MRLPAAVTLSMGATCMRGRSTRLPRSLRRLQRLQPTSVCVNRAERVHHELPNMAHVPAERCLSIIELLADGARDMPLGEIAERLALPKSGAHRLLATLIDRGWAEKDPDTSFYRLTMRLAVLGQQFFVATGIPDIWQPILDRFAQRCQEFARLAVVDGHSLVWVAHAQGASGGLMYQPSLTSNTVPLFATASGKAWLATLSVDRAMQLVTKNGGLKDAGHYGPNVVRSVDALLREIRA